MQASQAPEAGPQSVLDPLRVSRDAQVPGRYRGRAEATRRHWAGDGYAETQLWGEERRLVCHATQLMLIRIVEPDTVGAGPRNA